ncbi:MAG: undecaprenyl-diphosphate phosphatase [Candidatus Omnitrophica bacterium]|nr:undecaprenyl-diphosphate phosphatase [Candidatus Omnitrophota bacterium]
MREIVILSIVQGICEWFPVSSSGHLFLFHKILGIKSDITLDIFLHFSSLFVIFIFFKREILKLVKSFFLFKNEDENFKIVVYIIAASLVTFFIGLLLKDRKFLENKNFVSSGFFITTLFLFFSDKSKKTQKINFKISLLIGFSQGIALIPGISRSGATISSAKICGLNDEDAFKFSFLLAIPSIIGAIIIKMDEIKNIELEYIITGFIVSFIIGLLTLFLLQKIVMKRKFKYFCFYTFIVFLFSLFII